MARSTIALRIEFRNKQTQEWPLGRSFIAHLLSREAHLRPDIHSWSSSFEKKFNHPFTDIEECRRHWLDQNKMQTQGEDPFYFPSEFCLKRFKKLQYRLCFTHGWIDRRGKFLGGGVSMDAATAPPVDWIPLLTGWCDLLAPLRCHVDPQFEEEELIFKTEPGDDLNRPGATYFRRIPWVFGAHPDGPTPLPVDALRGNGFTVHEAGGLQILQLTDDVLDFKKRPEHFAERKALATSLFPERYFTEPYELTPRPKKR